MPASCAATARRTGRWVRELRLAGGPVDQFYDHDYQNHDHDWLVGEKGWQGDQLISFMIMIIRIIIMTGRQGTKVGRAIS